MLERYLTHLICINKSFTKNIKEIRIEHCFTICLICIDNVHVVVNSLNLTSVIML